jgi:hypothetical protein
MANRQIDIPLAAGMNEGADAHEGAPDKPVPLRVVKNVRLNHDGALEKRQAYQAVTSGTVTTGGANVSGFGNLVPHNGALIGLKDYFLYTRTSLGWNIPESPAFEMSGYGAPLRTPVARDVSGHCVDGGTAYANGFLGHCWCLQRDQDWDRFIEARIEHRDTGAIISTEYVGNPINRRGCLPRIVAFGTKILLFFVELSGTEGSPLGTLVGYPFDTTTRTWGTVVSVATSITMRGPVRPAEWDLSVGVNDIAILYQTGTITSES